MQSLSVIYDPRCGLCTQLKDWIGRQPSYVRVLLFASGSDEARRLFPSLPEGELAAISDSGEVWLGDGAWIMVLWALREYRGWARRLASPALLPLARQGFAAISRHKLGISRLLGLRSETDVKNYLRSQTVPPCQIHP
jgi:predicted DCC family thiol-disulfide oxidoreductase YuxK